MAEDASSGAVGDVDVEDELAALWRLVAGQEVLRLVIRVHGDGRVVDAGWEEAAIRRDQAEAAQPIQIGEAVPGLSIAGCVVHLPFPFQGLVYLHPAEGSTSLTRLRR